jgi:hypothetical protein
MREREKKRERERERERDEYNCEMGKLSKQIRKRF